MARGATRAFGIGHLRLKEIVEALFDPFGDFAQEIGRAPAAAAIPAPGAFSAPFAERTAASTIARSAS